MVVFKNARVFFFLIKINVLLRAGFGYCCSCLSFSSPNEESGGSAFAVHVAKEKSLKENITWHLFHIKLCLIVAHTNYRETKIPLLYPSLQASWDNDIHCNSALNFPAYI